MQNETYTKSTLNIYPLKEKWLAFNWNVYEINGHSYTEIKKAFGKFYKSKSKPTILRKKTNSKVGTSLASWRTQAPAAALRSIARVIQRIPAIGRLGFNPVPQFKKMFRRSANQIIFLIGRTISQTTERCTVS